jgi:hypothetical protein
MHRVGGVAVAPWMTGAMWAPGCERASELAIAEKAGSSAIAQIGATLLHARP